VNPTAQIGFIYPAAIVFWALVPPAWFFAEYWLIDHDYVLVPNNQKKQYLESVKTYGDYASKIWAAVLAAVLFLHKPL
jgi:hypothetical protein